ncbi:hypothetical protein CYY_004847 [Polysphondylium violaceum]|uniref:RING-type E3 ubiquitin transferase n=1 Tax=Polysphondylium violaceum TaxID=133409 RepID=A0A8J4PUR5_9MYCE|nr:hypothetical protein CYY_004847 [Polysphondylium violaceum]
MYNNNDSNSSSGGGRKDNRGFSLGRGTSTRRAPSYKHHHTTTTSTTTTTSITNNGTVYSVSGGGYSGTKTSTTATSSPSINGIKTTSPFNTSPIKYNDNNAPKQFQPRISLLNTTNTTNNNIITNMINNNIKSTINKNNSNINNSNEFSLLSPPIQAPIPTLSTTTTTTTTTNLMNSSPFKSTNSLNSNISIIDELYQSDYLDDDKLAILEAALSSPPTKSPTKSPKLFSQNTLNETISPIKNTTTTTTTTTSPPMKNNNNNNDHTYKNPFTQTPTTTTTKTSTPPAYTNPFSTTFTNETLATRTPDIVSPKPSPKIEPSTPKTTTPIIPAFDDTDTASHELILQLLQQDIQDLGLDIDVRKDPYQFEYYPDEEEEEYYDENNDMSYEALSQLEPVRVGITEEQKKTIKEYRYNQYYQSRVSKSLQNEEDSKRCCICLDDYQDASLVKELRCKHFFHSDCIDTWLYGHNKCPACRDEV